MSEEPGDAATAYIAFFFSLMRQGMVATDTITKFVQMMRPDAPFAIPELNYKGQVSSNGAIAGYSKEMSNRFSVPLIILSVVEQSGTQGIARYELLRAFLSAVLAYSRNSQLEFYDGFNLCMQGTSLYLCRVKASQAYMRDLFENKTISRGLPFYRTESFDLLDRDSRREAARLLVGLFRYLDKSEQQKVAANYGY